MKNIIKTILPILVFAISFFLLKSIKVKTTEVSVEINAEFTKPDRVQLFYSFNNSTKVSEKQSINKRVKGKTGFQNIKFKIPIDSLDTLTSIRLDISSNSKQKSINLKSLSFKTNTKTIIYEKDIEKYFQLNKYLTFADGVLKTKKVKTNYDPYLSLKTDQTEIIKRLTHKKPKFTLALNLGLCLTFSLFTFIILLYVFKKNKTLSTVNTFIIAFCLLISLPTIFDILNLKEKNNTLENREITKKPKYKFSKSYFKEYEIYFNDNFSFRSTLTSTMASFKIACFGSSPFPNKVKFGKEKFLFLNTKATISSYTNSNTLTTEALKETITKFSERKQKMNTNSIKYIFGYFPNKHSIYKEFLPYSMSSQIHRKISLANQIKQVFKDNNLKFFDPSEALINNKNENLLYLKLDTHWNKYGAYIAYHNFLNENKTLEIKPYELNDFDITHGSRNWGDLTKLIGVKEISGYKEDRFFFKLKDKKSTYKKVDIKGYPPRTIKTINKNSSNKKKAIFFGDSYSIYWLQFISLHFNEVIYIRGVFNQELIDKEKPDVVMELALERLLHNHL